MTKPSPTEYHPPSLSHAVEEEIAATLEQVTRALEHRLCDAYGLDHDRVRAAIQLHCGRICARGHGFMVTPTVTIDDETADIMMARETLHDLGMVDIAHGYAVTPEKATVGDPRDVIADGPPPADVTSALGDIMTAMYEGRLRHTAEERTAVRELIWKLGGRTTG